MPSIEASVGKRGKNIAKDVRTVQALLNRHADWLPGKGPDVTGTCDAATVEAISAFQTGAAALAKADGLVSPNGFTIRRLAMAAIPEPRHRVFLPVCWAHPEDGIPEAAYEAAAKTLACSKAAIKAVAETETKRAAWEDAGRPTILFERHYFSRLTHRAYDHTHPDIANPAAGHYGLFRAQYGKLYRAATLDEEAALESASWGSFQIMGANYAEAGFDDVDAFVDAMIASQSRHLDAFVAFIKASPARQKALQALDWATFAKLYNGANYKKNDYDAKMADAYAKLAPAPTPGATAAAPR